MSIKPVADFQDAKPETITVVAVPVDIFQDIVEVLQELPFKSVGKLLTRMGGLQAQQVEVTRSP